MVKELDGNNGVTLEHAVDDAGMPLVKIVGEIDISNSEALQDALDAIIEQRSDWLALDLSEISFMDSSGIAVLLRSAGKANNFEIRNPSRIVLHILEATGLTEILRVHG